MKQLIVQGLQQAYQNLVHMISIFLPRLVAMLLIMLVGLFVALLLKYLLRLILRFTQLNRLSEESGASQVLRNAALPTISELLTRSLFWVTWLAFTLVGISILGIPELHEQLSRLFQAVAGDLRRHSHPFRGCAGREFSFASGLAGCRECWRSLAADLERLHALRDPDSGYFHGARANRIGQPDRHFGFFDQLRCAHVGAGHRLRTGRARFGPPNPGKISRRQQEA